MLTTKMLSQALAPLVALAITGSATIAGTAEVPPAMVPETINWSDAPPVLPPGAKITVLSGDPGAAGPFVLRLKFPSGYEIAAHTHSGDELITVISGVLNIGHGEKLDRERGQALPVGGFIEMPAGHPHFAWADTETVVQIHGPGPFDITYLDSTDDPLTQ